MTATAGAPRRSARPGTVPRAMRVLTSEGLPDRIELDGDDLVVHAENLDVLARLPDGAFDMIYIDPPFNTGRPQRRRTLATAPHDEGDRVGFGGRRYRSELLQALVYEDRFGDYLGFLAPRLEQARRLLARARDALLPHRLPRGALLQAAARRAVRARLLPQRDRLGLRLRREAENALAGEARHDPRLRAHARRPPLRRRGGRPRAVHGARSRDAGEGRAGQAADRRLVAHDRADQQRREDRLPDAEAGRDRAADGRRLVQTGRLVPRLLRRLRHARRGARPSSAAATCSSTPTRRRSRSCADGSAGTTRPADGRSRRV